MPATKVPSHHLDPLTLHRHGEAKAVGGRLTRHEGDLSTTSAPAAGDASVFVLHGATSDVARGASQELAARDACASRVAGLIERWDQSRGRCTAGRRLRCARSTARDTLRASRVKVRERLHTSRTKPHARLCGIATAAVLAMAPSPAAAESPVAERDIREALDVARERCLDPDRLAPSVGSWLKRERLDARIRVVVRYEGDAISYSFFLGDDFVGKRWFRDLARACPDVVHTLSLAIAVAIEANFLAAPLEASSEASASPERESPPHPPETKQETSPVAVPETRRAPAQPMTAREEPPRWSLAAAPVVLWSVLPKVASGGVASAETAWSRLLETRMSLLVTAPVDFAMAAGRAEAQLFAFRADACVVIGVSTARVRGCGGFAMGLVTSETTGLLVERSRLFPWSAVAGRIDGRLPLTKWGAAPVEWTVGAFAGVDVLVTVRRPVFLVDYERGSAVDRVNFPALGVAPSAGIFFELP